MIPREVSVLFILCTNCSLGVAGVACVVVVNDGESADVMKLLVFARVRETTYVLSEGA